MVSTIALITAYVTRVCLTHVMGKGVWRRGRGEGSFYTQVHIMSEMRCIVATVGPTTLVLCPYKGRMPLKRRF